MKHRLMWVIPVLAIAVVIYVAGCSGSGTSLGGDVPGVTGAQAPVSTDPSLTPMGDAAADAPAPADPGTATAQAAGVTPAQAVGPTLTVRLTTGLETYGTNLVTAITGAALVRGATSRTATMTSGAAVFDMTGLTKGFYNIRINGLGTAVVPCKIDDPTVSMTQYVSKTLTDSVIGTLTNPKYRIRTYPGGQAQHHTAKFSDGTDATPVQYAYVMLYTRLNPVRIEFHRLATNQYLSTYAPNGGPHDPKTWIIGSTSHGAGSTSSCSGCHGTLSSKPATWTSCTKTSGWCYKCHYGPTGGHTAGMVHPAQ